MHVGQNLSKFQFSNRFRFISKVHRFSHFYPNNLAEQRMSTYVVLPKYLRPGKTMVTTPKSSLVGGRAASFEQISPGHQATAARALLVFI